MYALCVLKFKMYRLFQESDIVFILGGLQVNKYYVGTVNQQTAYAVTFSSVRFCTIILSLLKYIKVV